MSRHRRTPSVPLRVRTTSISTSAASLEVVLSPSSAELPVASAPSSTKSSEKYGFVVYVGSAVAWYAYLIWAFLPDAWLKAVGIEWYPAREWAILFPAWIMMAVVFVYVSYMALNLYNTPPLDSLTVLTDTQAHFPPSNSTVPLSVSSDPNEDYIPPLFELSPSYINQILFHSRTTT